MTIEKIEEIVGLVRHEFGPGMEYIWKVFDDYRSVVMLSDENQQVLVDVAAGEFATMYSFHKTFKKEQPC